MTRHTKPPRTHSTAESDAYRVLVSGGSMGGLFTGLALRDDGHDVRVYEQSSGALKHRGAGIVAQPQMLEFLERHGVANPEQLTTTSQRRRYLAPDGSVRRSSAARCSSRRGTPSTDGCGRRSRTGATRRGARS